MATSAAADTEDLAVSLTPHSRSVPLYQLMLFDDDGGDAALPQACAKGDASAAHGDDELLRAARLPPLRLPPRLQQPSCSAGASPSTSSSTSSPTPAANRSKHMGFDPFAAALEKVRGDAAGDTMLRRDWSLGDDDVATVSAHSETSSSGPTGSKAAAQTAGTTVATRPTTRRKKKGVRHRLRKAVMGVRPSNVLG
ncbi:hypothetical protein ACP70R_030079 [Stipagrostis hirtigluma subsp. patula]